MQLRDHHESHLLGSLPYPPQPAGATLCLPFVALLFFLPSDVTLFMCFLAKMSVYQGPDLFLVSSFRIPQKPGPCLALSCHCCLVAKSCLTLCDPMDCSPPGPLSMDFSRQEYWSGLPFLSAGDLPDPGVKPVSPALAGRFFTTEPPGKPLALSKSSDNCTIAGSVCNHYSSASCCLTTFFLHFYTNLRIVISPTAFFSFSLPWDLAAVTRF